jgi:hypothetical protein
MTASKRLPARFNLLTVIIWLLVAAAICFILWQVITRISGSNLPVSTATPNQTLVYRTIAALMTAQHTGTTGTATRTGTPSPTTQSSPVSSIPSQNKTSTPRLDNQTSTPEIACNRAAAGKPIDITIPDDSLLSPGASFIKTWKLVNIGTCTWTTSYYTSFFYGDRMGAPETIALKETVLPAQSVEVSIEMVAPMYPGTYQGNWKLSDPDGALFGIGPNSDSPIWVRIIVPENRSNTATVTPATTPTFSATESPTVTVTTSPTQSPSPTITSSPTQNPSPTSSSTNPPAPTATVTPPVQAKGELTAIPGDAIDLDTLTVNGDGEDLVYQVDPNNYHWLAPKDGATIGVFGNLEPSLADCLSASMSPAPIALESLSTDLFCYTTNQGLPGWAHFLALDPTKFTLSLDLLTWALP